MRGLLPKDLVNCDLWWNGPHWLHGHPTIYPEQPLHIQPHKDIELKVSAIHSVEVQSNIWLEAQFSSYKKLIRITAWIRCFTRNLQSKLEKTVTQNCDEFLSLEELKTAEVFLIQSSQQRSFATEIKIIKAGIPLQVSNSLLTLHSVLIGLLRVGGHLANAQLSAAFQKHPMILHGKVVLTRLIVTSKHQELLHAGPTLMMANLNSKYHVIGAKRLACTIYKQCVVYRKAAARTGRQSMGQLPSSRVTPGSVFNNVGIEYAGPVITKRGHTQRLILQKTYICVFVCMAVKAVQLEAVSDLTSEAFISALKRFISRRGKPSQILSDNGTNFVGANNHLKEVYKFLAAKATQDQVMKFTTSNR